MTVSENNETESIAALLDLAMYRFYMMAKANP
jgi:hypothetical protein